MKNSIRSTAILLAAASPCVAFVYFLGAPFAPVTAAEVPVGAYLLLLISLMLVGDYSPRRRIRLALRPQAVSADAGHRESHRLAA